MNKIILVTLVFIWPLSYVVWSIDAPAGTQVGLLTITKVNPKDGAQLLMIPEGEFLMGTSEEELTALLKAHPTLNRNWVVKELPQRKVELDTFYIYKTEVTVAQYRKFCNATKREMPNSPDWGWQETHPIVNVKWSDAKAYADWAGAILPSEAQWEKAARGIDGQIYPWGNNGDTSKAQCSKEETGDAKKTVPVGSFPAGASPYGVMDMAGNVWEWCSDIFDKDYYKTAPVNNPTGPIIGTTRVLRGGSWDSNISYYDSTRCAVRYNSNPNTYGNNIGFRCAFSTADTLVDNYIQSQSKSDTPSVINSSTPIQNKPDNPLIKSTENLIGEVVSGLFNGLNRTDDKKTIPTHLPTTVKIKIKINPKDGEEMILIPAGEFLMGTSEEQLAKMLKTFPQEKREDFTHELPQHKVELSSYYIYKTEVTVAQYRKFCEATKRAMPEEPFWKWQDNHPIVNVNWYDAKIYADWAGVSLPTEAQWEKAARGTDGRIYPWGNVWDDRNVQCSKNVYQDAEGTAPVGSFPSGASPYGVMDMAGNVWEWCSDRYDENYYNISPVKNPTGSDSSPYRVERGGGWDTDTSISYCASVMHRGNDRPANYDTRNRNGFRCVSNTP